MKYEGNDKIVIFFNNVGCVMFSFLKSFMNHKYLETGVFLSLHTLTLFYKIYWEISSILRFLPAFTEIGNYCSLFFILPINIMTFFCHHFQPITRLKKHSIISTSTFSASWKIQRVLDLVAKGCHFWRRVREGRLRPIKASLPHLKIVMVTFVLPLTDIWLNKLSKPQTNHNSTIT